MSRPHMLSVAMHCHSEWSYDAEWSLRDLARFFGRMGVDVMLMSEHDTRFPQQQFEKYRQECQAASTPACTLIPGIEYSSPDNAVHILAWGLDHFLAEDRPVMETLERVRAAGGVAVLAHPARRSIWKMFDPVWVPYLAGIEIWNRKTDGIFPGEHAMRIARETGLPPLVGVDFHQLRHFYPLDHRVEAAPGQSIESAVLSAMATGRMLPRVLRARVMRPPSDGLALMVRLHQPAERLRRSLARLRKRGISST
jgi:predicted metal-dependent phosphoesterase TrpH